MKTHAGFLLFLCMSVSGRCEDLVFSPSSANISIDLSSSTLPIPLKLHIDSNLSSGIAFQFIGASADPPQQFAPIDPFTVLPALGITPADVTVDLDPVKLFRLFPGAHPYSLYSFPRDVTTGNPAVVRIHLNLVAQPPPIISSVVNAANNQLGSITPIEIVSISGDHLTNPYNVVSLQNIPPGFENYGFPLLAGRTFVTFNGIRAPLLYAGVNQINAVVPAGIAGAATVDIIVNRDDQASSALRLPVSEATPGIFSVGQGGSGQGLVLNADYTVADTKHPASPGSYISIYATGCGLLSSGFLDGLLIKGAPFPETNVPVAVTIGGKPAQVTYSGAAPTYVYGLIQINAIVPADAAQGLQPVVLTVAGKSSRSDLAMVVR